MPNQAHYLPGSVMDTIFRLLKPLGTEYVNVFDARTNDIGGVMHRVSALDTSRQWRKSYQF